MKFSRWDFGFRFISDAQEETSHIRQSTEIGIDFVVASDGEKEQQGK
jgi:hypothetical protein